MAVRAPATDVTPLRTPYTPEVPAPEGQRDVELHDDFTVAFQRPSQTRSRQRLEKRDLTVLRTCRSHSGNIPQVTQQHGLEDKPEARLTAKWNVSRRDVSPGWQTRPAAFLPYRMPQGGRACGRLAPPGQYRPRPPTLNGKWETPGKPDGERPRGKAKVRLLELSTALSRRFGKGPAVPVCTEPCGRCSQPCPEHSKAKEPHRHRTMLKAANAGSQRRKGPGSDSWLSWRPNAETHL